MKNVKLVAKLEELIENLDNFESFLTDGTNGQREIVINLIKNGQCFIAYEINAELRFAPSRFIGYARNEPIIHASKENIKKHGTTTTKIINDLLGFKRMQDIILEEKYQNFCLELGATPQKRKHKFWKYKLGKDFGSNKSIPGDFPEGKVIERLHKYYERNPALIKYAKDSFKIKHGKLICQICKFDFELKYGEVGRDFIEAHHTIPVSEMVAGHRSVVGDIAMLCSNCHRMIHRKRPWLKMEDIEMLQIH